MRVLLICVSLLLGLNSSSALAQAPQDSPVTGSADCFAEVPSNSAAILAQYSTQLNGNEDIPSYTWESLLRAAGMYQDDLAVDVMEAFVKQAAIFNARDLDAVHLATDHLLDALDEAKDVADEALVANCGLFVIRSALRADPVNFGIWAFLADAGKGKGGDAARMIESYAPNAARQCMAIDSVARYPETVLRCMLHPSL